MGSATHPKITIVTPSFNQAAYLEKTICSVLNQSYPNLEFFVFDGGSTDGSKDILQKYSDHIHYWVSEKDNGQSHAINKGLERATGEIFNWINSDDQLAPGALFKVSELYKKHGQPHLIAGAALNTYADTPNTDVWLPKKITGISTFVKACAVMPHAQPSTFFHTATLRELGGVRDDLQFRMDWELYLRFFLAKRRKLKTCSTNDILSKAFTHPQTKTSLSGSRFDDEAKKILEECFDKLKPSERITVTHFFKRSQIQEEVVLARKKEKPVSHLMHLATTHPRVLSYRFFWGALLQELKLG